MLYSGKINNSQLLKFVIGIYETYHFRGTAIVQIGDCVREINGDKDPTMVIIPGNTPHQITNKKKEPAMLYYYFPGMFNY